MKPWRSRIATVDFLEEPSNELKAALEKLPEEVRETLLGEYVKIAKSIPEDKVPKSRPTLLLFRAWALDPELFRMKVEIDNYISRKGRLDLKLKEYLAILIAESYKSKDCSAFHSSSARLIGIEEDKIEQIRNFGRNKEAWPEKERRALEFGLKVSLDPTQISDKEVEGLKLLGYSDAEIMELTLAALLYAEYPKFNIALGLDVP